MDKSLQLMKDISLSMQRSAITPHERNLKASYEKEIAQLHVNNWARGIAAAARIAMAHMWELDLMALMDDDPDDFVDRIEELQTRNPWWIT